MPDPEIATREQWVAARRELLGLEKELSHRRDEVNAARRRLPMVEIDQGLRLRGTTRHDRRCSTCSKAAASC